TESQQATDLFMSHAPALAGVSATLVFSTEDGGLADAPNRTVVERTLAEVRKLHGVAELDDPFKQVSADGRIAAGDVRYDIGFDEVEAADGRALERAVAQATDGTGVDVEMRGV